MNYSKHYSTLIERAKARQKPPGYVERHHTVPRCLGGTDDPSNLVYLTANEHFVAHQLLAKMFPDSVGAAYAAFAMGNESNKRYARLRKAYSIKMTGLCNPMKRPEVAKKTSEALTGRVFSSETVARMSASKVGSNHPFFGTLRPSHRVAISGSGNGMFGKTHSSLVKQKLSELASLKTGSKNPMFGRKHSEASIKKMKSRVLSQDTINKFKASCFNRVLKVCPHCGKEGKGGNMTRFHFDNCISQIRS